MGTSFAGLSGPGPRGWALGGVLALVLAASWLLVTDRDRPLENSGLWSIERTVSATDELADGATCRIEQRCGDLTVVAGEGRRATIRARIRASGTSARAAADAARLATVVLTASPREIAARVSALPAGVIVDLAATVPAGVPLDLRSTAGRTALEGVGPATVRTEAGEIELSCPAGPFDVESLSGPVTVTLRREQRHESRVRTLRGDVHVRAQFEAPAGRTAAAYPLTVVARSEHGRVNVPREGEPGPRLTLESVDGSIDVEAIW